MKKSLVFIMSLFVIMVLAACGSTSNEVESEVEKDEKETEEVAEKETKENVDVNDVENIMILSMSEGDKLIDISIENDEIKVIVDIEESDISPRDVWASNIYSLASDELLNNFKGWNTFTVEYIDIGTVSMDRSQSELDEYGEYFPSEKIDEILNIKY